MICVNVSAMSVTLNGVFSPLNCFPNFWIFRFLEDSQLSMLWLSPGGTAQIPKFGFLNFWTGPNFGFLDLLGESKFPSTGEEIQNC